MEKTISPQEAVVRECVRQFQANECKEAFNTLLDKYYNNSCKYASKFLNNKVYSNMINGSFEEVKSYVFLAFWKAVKNYRLEGDSSLSFKNYLYQLIKFETINEIKKNFNGQCIPKAAQKGCREDETDLIKNSRSACKDLEFRDKVLVIEDFLNSKKKEYALIWSLKVKDIKNSDICDKLQITEAELKSRGQYIKKLILDKYSSLEKIC